MARLALGIVGGVVGGYFGGPIGAAVGSQVGSFLGGLIDPGKLPNVYGPRLSDRGVQSAAFGAHINVLFGMDRIAGNIIFSSGLKETPHKKKISGKGGLGQPKQSQITFTYSVDMTIAFCKRAQGVRRIWFDTKLVYDASDQTVEGLIAAGQIEVHQAGPNPIFTIRRGDEDQLPSALEESYHGVGNVSAHRNLFCLEVADMQLANFGNRIPNITAEIFNDGDSSLQVIDSVQPFPEFPGAFVIRMSWAFIQNGEFTVFGKSAPTGGDPYSDPGYIVRRVLPSGVVADFKVPEIDYNGETLSEFFGANGMNGHADEPCYMTLGNAIWRVRHGYEVRWTLPGGFGSPSFWTLSQDEICVYAGFGVSPTKNIATFRADSGALITNSASLTGYGLATGLDFSTSFYYVIVPSGGNDLLLQLNRDTLAVIQDWDLGGTSFVAISVKSESAIYLAQCSNGALPTNFYLFSAADGSMELLGSVVSGLSPPSDTNNMIYSDGIFYCSPGPNFVGGGNGPITRIAFVQSSETTVLWKIVRDLCAMVGTNAPAVPSLPVGGDIVVDDLIDEVHGYTITREMTAREAIVKLQEAYFFDCRERDLLLDFPKRGKAPVATLNGDDLSARPSLQQELPDRLGISRAQETECPLRIHLVYNNWEANYQRGHEYAPRLITESKEVITLECPVAITATEASKIAYVHLAIAWLERESFKTSSSRKQLLLDAADNVTVTITEAIP